MKILAIETATEACSAAVLNGNEYIERYEVAPRRHNELILPMCETVLAECGLALNHLDAVAFGCGPGAFTGVRIAAGVTQGIAYAQDLPVVPVSTLANLAQQAADKDSSVRFILPAIDARMEEIYWAVYANRSSGTVELHGHEQVQDPNKIKAHTDRISCGLGSGWRTYQQILQEKTQLQSEDNIDGSALPRAKTTAKLAARLFSQQIFVDAADALPVYLRDNVVHQK